MKEISNVALVTELSQEAFLKQIKSLNRKAKRLGVPEIKAEFLRKVEKERTVIIDHNDDGEVTSTKNQYKVACGEWKLSHVDIKQDGWTLLGRFSPVEGELNYVEDFSNGSLNREKYENSDACHCDHCQQKRNRKYGWIVSDESGKEMQVGSSCLKELTGGLTAAALEFSAFIWKSFSSTDEDGFWDGSETNMRDVPMVSTLDVLALSLSLIQESGWASKEFDRYGYQTNSSTNQITANLIRNGHGIDFSEHVKDAEKLLEEGLEVNDEAEFWSEMQYNLHQKFIPVYKAGLVAYLWKALEEKKIHEKQAQSEWVGTIKKRQDFSLEVVKVHSFESDYGWVHINTFMDSEGNAFVWKTGTWNFSDRIGETVEMKATIKDHSEYNGIKQTILTRAKIKD